jgi:hypothetical protein
MVRVDYRSPQAPILRSVLVSLVFLAVGIAVYVFFIATATGQLLDASSFGAVMWLRVGGGGWASALRTLLLVASGALFVVLLVVALLQRRAREAGVALVICVIALLLSGALKQFVVSRPHLGNFGYSYNTFPSGHETITVASLVGAYLLLPDRSRRPVILLLFLVLGTASGAFQVIAYAHRPSDVIGAALLVGAVAAWIPGRSEGIGARWRWTLWGIVAIAATGGTLCLVGWQTHHFSTSEQVIGTIGIVLATAAAVGGALIVGAERSTRSPAMATSLSARTPEPSAKG